MEQNTITKDDLMKRISKLDAIKKEAVMNYYTINNLYDIVCNTDYDEYIEKLKDWVLYANAIIAGTEELHEWVCSVSDMPVDKVAEVLEEYKNLDVDSQTEFRKRLGESKIATDSVIGWYFNGQKNKVFHE